MGEPNVRGLLAHRLHLPDRFLYQSNEEIKKIDFRKKRFRKRLFFGRKISKDKKVGTYNFMYDSRLFYYDAPDSIFKNIVFTNTKVFKFRK